MILFTYVFLALLNHVQRFGFHFKIRAVSFMSPVHGGPGPNWVDQYKTIFVCVRGIQRLK